MNCTFVQCYGSDNGHGADYTLQEILSYFSRQCTKYGYAVKVNE